MKESELSLLPAAVEEKTDYAAQIYRWQVLFPHLGGY